MRCDEKKQYDSEVDALMKGVRVLAIKGNDTRQLRAYKCTECDYWHLTSMKFERGNDDGKTLDTR